MVNTYNRNVFDAVLEEKVAMPSVGALIGQCS